ncbi:Major Facilitator Superfamily [uncultured Roseburia sp.]|uniref:MFS transporter n=1 Tax=Brotonthovivens ammoniilytica TaxID=2981725 RepID=A0ABT2TJV6_9FIRM|nr:MFS transporter [Brotonthovivens ammoniilytica]MCU6762499.1 MFS transporter [Brotonthovivens ammoniilytica]SCI73933.1 Major Facilitator Superfamily [uncultured Roseburia sp.]
MMRKNNYSQTVRAASVGYIVQAMINTFAPLLFVTFQNIYYISLAQVSMLILVNFAAQIALDFFASCFADRIGYRKCIIAAHILSAAGTAGLAFLPELFASPFTGLVLAVVIYGAGGGLTEVLLTPIVQACPIKEKDKAVSMLHSFYCWGSVLIIGLSTVFFKAAGIDNWKLLAVLWAVLPIANAVYFAFVPVYELVPEQEKMHFGDLARSKVFWLLMLFMFCAGSCEMAIAQWASSFAEEGLHVSKEIGDLAGPCMFAVLKGLERLWYGRKGEKIPLWGFMMFCSVLCAVCYLVIGLSSSAVIALIVCAVAGFSTGVMWPGTFAAAGEVLPKGGTALFGMLALAGDLGCGAGPAITGAVSFAMNDNLQSGFLFGTIFAVLMITGLLMLKGMQKRSCQ